MEDEDEIWDDDHEPEIVGYDEKSNLGDGVIPYLINNFLRSESYKRRAPVLLTNTRFNAAVNNHVGTESEKFTAAKSLYPRPLMARCLNGSSPSCFFEEHCRRIRREQNFDYSGDVVLVGELLSVSMRGGEVKGVLGEILSYV